MIATYRLATGALVQDNLAALPKDFDGKVFGWREQPALYPAERAWSAAVANFVDLETPASVEAQLLDALKSEAESRKMVFLSSGGAKKTEYAAKRAEVAFWDSLGGTVTAAVSALGLLSAPTKSAKFAYALADAAAFGDTVQAAIERFRVGANRCAKVPEIAAVEAKTAAAIRAATTAKAKRAAAASASWPA